MKRTYPAWIATMIAFAVAAGLNAPALAASQADTSGAPLDIHFLQQQAEAGNPEAMFILGVMYNNGEGVSEDKAEAARWFRKAAEKGTASAMFNLGLMYEDGNGVPRNAYEAVRWYAGAAELGNLDAMCNLAQIYFWGKGIPQDHVEAMRWYRKAADKGDAEAMFNLGLAFTRGDGVERSDVEAARWFRNAAEKNDERAMFLLGLMYDDGTGVAEDEAEAVRWYRRAAEEGHAGAMFNLGLAFARGQGVLKSGAAAADWYYRAGAKYLEDGRRDDALLCVERIRNLETSWGLTVPNAYLADDLMRAIYQPNGEVLSPPSGPNRSYGTGWLVAFNHVVTNNHVIEGKRRIQIAFSDGSTANATVRRRDKANDLVLLQIDSADEQPLALPVANSGARSGERVFTIGYPHPDIMGGEPKVTDGIISAVLGVGDDVRLYQVSVPVQAGNSGGPLFNMRGEVVAVVVAKLNAAQVFAWTGDLPENVNYAIKVSYLTPLIEAEDLRLPPPSHANEPSGNLETLVRRLAASVVMVIAD